MAPSSRNPQKRTGPSNAPLSDEEAAVQAQLGNFDAEEFLLKKYARTVKRIAKPYFMQGADKEDVIQEGTIGLFEAIHSFSPEKLCTFKSFSHMCITRQIITAVKSYSRQKHIPLNDYVSFHHMRNDFEDPEPCREPQDLLLPALDDLLISQEWLQNMQTFVDSCLSPFEKLVFQSFVDGKSYQTISEELNKPVKSIDGTLQRVRRKFKEYLREEDE